MSSPIRERRNRRRLRQGLRQLLRDPRLADHLDQPDEQYTAPAASPAWLTRYETERRIAA